MHYLLFKNKKVYTLFWYSVISILLGMLFAYKLLSSRAGFISTNPNYSRAQKFLIPFSGVNVQYAVLFIFVFVFIIAFFFTVEEFTNGKEKTLFALLPLRYSDIVFAKLLIVTKKVLLIAFLVFLPFAILYGEKVFALLKPVLLADKFAVLIIAYIILSTFYIAAISIIAVTLSFIFVVVFESFSYLSDRLGVFKSSPVWVNFIVAGSFGAFSLAILNAVLSSSNRYFIRIYGYPPVSYISKAIVDLTRPVPNVLYSVKVVFWLIITVSIFLLMVFGASVIADKKYLACPQSSFKEVKQIGNVELKEFGIFRNLPIFVKKDVYAFLRKGNTFKWLSNSFILAVIIPLIFYTPAILSKEISAKLTYIVFGIKINYLALLILTISLVQFSQVAFYVFYSDESDVFLLKVTSVNVKKYLLEKFLAAAIIAVVPLAIIVAVTFIFFAHAQSPYYMNMAIIQFFILFFWDFTSSFYIGGIGTKVISGKVSFWQVKNGRLSTYLVVLSFASLLVWSVIYKFVLKIPNIFGISIVATEIVLPILILGKIIKRVEDTIKKIDLCSSD